MSPGRRIMLAKTALDGHWHGPSLVAGALRDAGHEVIMLGMASASEIARAVEDEDVDLLGLNVGGRVEVVERIVEAVRAARPALPILAGGAIAPWMGRRLAALDLGVFPPGSALRDIVAAVDRLTGCVTRTAEASPASPAPAPSCK